MTTFGAFITMISPFHEQQLAVISVDQEQMSVQYVVCLPRSVNSHLRCRFTFRCNLRPVYSAYIHHVSTLFTQPIIMQTNQRANLCVSCWRP